VLFRGSHEGGTVRNLCKELFGTEVVPSELSDYVKKADRWAADADRPKLPWRRGPLPEWSKVSFSNNPELIHPVSGERIRIKEHFRNIGIEHIERVSTDHFEKLIVRDDKNKVDAQKTFLKFWRFGPETPAPDLNVLWQLLPADTRSPEHSIWDHLKLCSALAGIFSLGSQPAILVVSLGPVQKFIAQARRVSDLWAGSHFLSLLCWQAMEPICDRFGPDSVLFPDLRGVPPTDEWLVKKGICPQEEDSEEKPLDVDPRMAAALPNRFVALVPSDQVGSIVVDIERRAREWALKQAHASAERLFKPDKVPETTLGQLKEQFKDFPEIYWASAPWHLVKESGTGVDATQLFKLLSVFGPWEMAAEVWNVLSSRLIVGQWKLYEPNAGAAYTYLYRLADKLHAATKSIRVFESTIQHGYRCSICGEREWLTDSKEKLHQPVGRRQETPWQRLSNNAGFIREGEFLCGWCTLKRFWPSIYTEEIIKAKSLNRYVVSTYTMALVPSIETAIKRLREGQLKISRNTLDKLIRERPSARAAFPRRVWKKLKELKKEEKELFDVFTTLPILLDRTDEEEDQERSQELEKSIEELFGTKPETYYALVLMDGDRMGAWLSGTDVSLLPTYEEILHSSTSSALKSEFREKISRYLNAKRPNTPARHQAISRALNQFAIKLARHVVEEIFSGKLIYAGGDDLLAMVSVRDLLGLMGSLRLLYSGIELKNDEEWAKLVGEAGKFRLQLSGGYAYYEESRNIYHLMGSKATASIGAVVAHHKAPLGRVLRSLRDAERRAKVFGGRNAFCITIEKRAGGIARLVSKWNYEDISAIRVLIELRDRLAEKGVSRRAVYIIHEVLKDIPPDDDVLKRIIVHRLKRQGAKDVGDIVERLVCCSKAIDTLALKGTEPAERFSETTPARNRWLQEMFLVAEFLAREGRV